MSQNSQRHTLTSAAFATAIIMAGLSWLLVKWEVLSSGEAFEIIRLWPLALVLLGLEMFLRGSGKRIHWSIGAGVVFGATLVLWLVPGAGPGFGAGSDVKGALSVSTDPTSPDALSVALKVGAMELAINGKSQDNLTIDYVGVEPQLEDDGSEVVVAGRQGRWGSCGRIGSPEASWDVHLPLGRPMELDIDAGAARIVADLTGLDISRVNVDAGAADIHLRLPNRIGETEVELDTGASDITIEVPERVAIRLTSDSAMTSTTLDDLELTKRGDALFSPDFDTASARVTIDIDSAVSDLTVKRR